MNRIYFSLFFFVFLSCNKKETVLQIDPLLGTNDKEDNIDLFHLFDEIKIIRLENVPDSFYDITNLKLSASTFFLIEAFSKNAYKYNLDLNEFEKLFNYGEGPNEIKEVSNILIANNRVFIFSKPQNKLFVADQSGSIKQEIKFNFYPSNISVSNNLFFFQNGFFEKSGYFLKSTDFEFKNFNLHGSYPVISGQQDYKFSGYLNGPYFSYPFDSKIYEIQKGNEILKYDFKSDIFIPKDEIFDHQKVDKYIRDFENPKSYIKEFFIRGEQGFIQFSIKNKIKYAIVLPSGAVLGTDDFNLTFNPFLIVGMPFDFQDGYFYSVIGEKFRDWFLYSEQKIEIIEFYKKENAEVGKYLEIINEDSPPAILKFKLKKSID